MIFSIRSSFYTRANIFLLQTIILLGIIATPHLQGQQTSLTASKRTSRQDSSRIVQMQSVNVTSTRAVEGQTPITFSEIDRKDILQRSGVYDLPKLFSETPSIIFYSDNGNAIGYSTLTMRGFDQRRIAVFINGIPQNDPEDHNVYWINFPDIASSLQSVQIQRGAGLVNYGAAAIGGSINLTTSTFANQRYIRATAGIGFQEYADGERNKIPSNVLATGPNNAVERYGIELASGLFSHGDAEYAVYARLSRITSRGYRDNSWTDLPSYFITATRFDSLLTTQLNIFGGTIADGLAYTGLPKSYALDARLRRTNFSAWEYDASTLDSNRQTLSYATTRRPQERESFSQPHYEILNDVRLGDNLLLKSSLFYYRGDGFFDYDASWADTTVLRLTEKYSQLRPTQQPTNTIIRAFVGNKHGGWLPRLVWKRDGGLDSIGGSEITIGAEYREHRSTHWGKIAYAENLPLGFDQDYSIYSYNGTRTIASGFARVMYRASSAVLLNAELQGVFSRYGLENERAGNIFTTYTTVNSATITNGARIFTTDYTFLNPRIGATLTISPTMMGYISAALTSREPRRNNLYAASQSFFGDRPLFATSTNNNTVRYDFSQPLIRPERMLNIEIGWNLRHQDIALSCTGYWMELTNALVRSGQRDIFGVPIDGNAPRARHIGIELTANMLLWSTHTWRLVGLANATISRNRIIDYRYQIPTGEINLSGNAIGGFPDLMGNARLSLTNNNLVVNISAQYVGKQYTDSFGAMLPTYQTLHSGFVAYKDNVIDGYGVVHADASYTLVGVAGLQALRFRFQCNNLLNTLYISGGNGAEFFPAAERNWMSTIEVEL